MTSSPAQPGERELDLVLVGATGFVGRLTAEHLAAQLALSDAPAPRVGLAGRSRARLAELRDDLGPVAAQWPLIEYDAHDTGGLRELAGRTRVVASAVGPYLRLGLPLVTACARAGTHYADLTGELLFVRRSADLAHEEAARTGARIVHACGFDSVPSDLAVLLTADRARADLAGGLEETVLLVRRLKGGFSGGTIDSARQQAIEAKADPWARNVLADPYALSPDRKHEPHQRRDPGASSLVDRVTRPLTRTVSQVVPVRRDRESGHWYGPFVMGPFNARVVRRSNALSGWSYGRGLRYQEVLDLGASPVAPVIGTGLAAGYGALFAALGNDRARPVVDRWLPKPGEGPSPQERDLGSFLMEVRATTVTGARYRTRFGAELDPGYAGTAAMFGQAALALTLDDLPGAGGVLTPATGIGAGLADRLRALGFTIDTQRLD